MTLRVRASAFFAVSIVLAAFLYASFFANFWSTLSDWSGFGFTWTHQMFHNYLSGRPYQSSLFATLDAGHSVGFSFNPYAFLHADAIHVNFTPYAFARLWALRPTPGMIYALIFAWNLAAGAWLSRSILRRAALKDGPERLRFAWGVLAVGGLLSVLCQMAQMLLFAGPFLLGAYDAWLSRRRGVFALWAMALTLVSEDAAMTTACFGACLFLFEDEGRPYGLIAAGVSVPYLLFLLLVVQPAARAELTLTGSTTTAVVAGKLLSLSARGVAENLRSMLPLAPFIPALALAAGLFGVPDRRGLIRAAGLAVFPALPHWGECVVVGGAHHLLPPWYGLFLGLLSWLRDAKRPAPAAALWAPLAAGVFVLISLRVQAGHLPLRLKPALYRLAGKADKAAALERSLTVEEASNRAVIAAAASIPADRSLVFLANNRVSGFITGRSEIWDFPAFYGRADCLLIQKDAIDANYRFVPKAGVPLEDVLAATPRSGERNQEVSLEMAAALRAALAKTHAVAREDEHILLFERRERVVFVNPPSTYGWGWTRAITKKDG
ncbi:MAG: DUF2079 domain-containing protein [Elusimicrobia bacterium]|nr:DUF2079 domain-containing protein [Elusimicrobiota bacterium]